MSGYIGKGKSVVNVESYTKTQADAAFATAVQGATADSALQSIADGSITEPKLQVSNTPTDGQLLSAQSGNTGGLTWADAPGSPVGSIVYHAANTAPTGYLKANGAAISRTTYADLFSAIGTTFGAGDGSTTFLVPDLRGEFLRGWDDARGVDGSRTFGSAQGDQMEAHNHLSGTVSYSGQTHKYGTVSSSGNSSTGSDSVSRVQSYTSTVGGTGNSSETRPRNIALLACIKY
jgi:phage-related tail fiber protein